MDELISKRTVIETIEKARANVGHNLERSIGKSIIEILDDVGRDINGLPSALGTNLAEVGTDAVSRQQAIDALDKRFDSIPMEQTSEILLLRKDLREMPPIQPVIIRCKDCKNWDTTWTNDFLPNYHYCPMVDGVRKEDWFCADAERREVDNERK